MNGASNKIYSERIMRDATFLARFGQRYHSSVPFDQVISAKPIHPLTLHDYIPFSLGYLLHDGANMTELPS